MAYRVFLDKVDKKTPDTPYVWFMILKQTDFLEEKLFLEDQIIPRIILVETS